MSRSSPTAPAGAIRARAAGARSCARATRSARLSGGEPLTTNNRMELMAAIAALEALKRPCRVAALHRQHLRPRRDHHVDPRLAAQRLAHRRQEAGQECRAVAGAGRRRRSRTASNGIGSRATAAIPRTTASTPSPAPRPTQRARRRSGREGRRVDVADDRIGRRHRAAAPPPAPTRPARSGCRSRPAPRTRRSRGASGSKP